ncbi:vWA-like protein [Suillus decipiens]|nr:vWA-like protein [Suillus decipiens]
MIYQSNPASAPLDIVFLQDATESQQPYIDAARSGITQICNTLLSGGKVAPQDIRFGLIAFRDHPPQEHSFNIQEYPFTSDVESFTSNLAGLTAAGGGDDPDCQSDALSAACKAQWRDGATKVAVLITDSPPHGIGENGDGFPEGCPLQIDPLHVATSMAEAGITLYVIACEPTLSQNYKRARDFYQGLVKKTGGKVVNLRDLSVLPTLIAGSALEAVDSEIYVAKHQTEVRSIANEQSISASEISLKLHKNFVAAGIQHSTLVVDNVCEQRTPGGQNVDIWFNAGNLGEARNKVEGNHVLEKYQAPGAEQSAAVETQLISLTQVETIVQKCLVRA